MAQQVEVVRIFCKENDKVSVAVRGSNLVLANADPKNESQQWRKDYSACGHLKDDQGRRAFALVNKATGQILVTKNMPPSDGSALVYLAPYNDKEGVTISMLWTEGNELQGGFRQVRVFKDITKVLNSLKHTIKNGSSIVNDGTTVGLFRSEPSHPNAVWKMDTIKVIDPPNPPKPPITPPEPARKPTAPN